MELIRTIFQKELLYLPHCFPYEIKEKKNKKGETEKVLEFFIHGKGWQKTKKFLIVEDVVLPDKWDKTLTWLDVAKLYDKYGMEVADTYASCMTAGIVSKQTAKGYGLIYRHIKHLINDIENFDVKFFEALTCDYTIACFGGYLFDIIAFDKELGKIDKDYDPENCLYLGKTASQSDYVKLKYGEKYVEIVNKLIHSSILN